MQGDAGDSIGMTFEGVQQCELAVGTGVVGKVGLMLVIISGPAFNFSSTLQECDMICISLSIYFGLEA